MKLTLRIWRQARGAQQGQLVDYNIDNVSEDMSFLEMLDMLNEELTVSGEEPVAFDSDCREGICGQCGVVIIGTAHGRGNSPVPTTTCQLHMRSFNDGDTIIVEPWKAEPFPVLKDLVVDRSAFDRIIQAGGFISVNTGSAPDAHSVPAPKLQSDIAFDNATCIGCGACVAACPNASAMLFTSAKISHRPTCHRVRLSVICASRTWLPSMTRKASVTAPTSASARRSARRVFRWSRSASSTVT